jgi:hypothetical protein
MKYKKGDLVRIVRNDNCHKLKIGAVLPIDRVKGESYLFNDGKPRHPWMLSEEEVEPVGVSENIS